MNNLRHILTCGLLLAAAMVVRGTEYGRSTYAPGTAGDFSKAVLPDKPGLYLRNELWYYEGHATYGRADGSLQVEADLSAWVDTPRLTWSSGRQFLGARYGAYLSLPLTYVESDAHVQMGPPGQPAISQRQADERSSLGDVYVSPWMLGWKLGSWDLLWYESVTIPSGTYKEQAVNASRNYYALNSSLAATWRRPVDGPELNLRLGYIVNDENHKTDYESGDELVGDITAAWCFNQRFSLGLTGYAYEQITGDQGAGALLGDFKGSSWGAGPIARYLFDRPTRRVALVAKWIHEFEAENRYEGDLLFIALGTRL